MSEQDVYNSLPFERKIIVQSLLEKLNLKVAIGYESKIWLASKKLSLDYPEFAYEKVGCLLSANSRDERTKVLNDINSGVDGWDAWNFSQIRKKKCQELAIMSQEIKMEKSDRPCRYCGSKKCFCWQEQTRSADEGMTTFYQCVKCGRRFRG
jgi:DNA-directed RNA polymerase subunit M/transcription elongation factor TFIIS